jgi:DNA-binding NarL/FixJ family response regulator
VIRVLVAEDSPDLRKALCEALEAAPGFTLVAQASTGWEALQRAAQSQPHVAVLDVRMPEMDGVEAARHLATLLPNIRVVLHTTERAPGLLKEAREAGVRGFVQKGEGLVELLGAIEAVAHGGTVGLA